MDDNLITIKMTRRQLEYLVEILYTAQDEGPAGAGWASDELKEMRGLFMDDSAKARIATALGVGPRMFGVY